MREEVHLPCSLDGFNVCPELVPNTRGHLKTAADLVPKSMRCHVVLPTSVVPVIQDKTVNCPPRSVLVPSVNGDPFGFDSMINKGRWVGEKNCTVHEVDPVQAFCGLFKSCGVLVDDPGI